MAGGGPIGGSTGSSNSNYTGINYSVPITLMSALFFMVGFITVLNDVLIPSMKEIFNFGDDENWKLMLIQFCFFTAYGVMSFPAGIIINKIGYKKGTVFALLIVATGLFMFLPAANMESYPFFLVALFIVGNGLAMLQVAINPYLIACGPAETGASRLNLGGALNSTATAVGPILGAWLILDSCVPPAEKIGLVRGPYIILGLIIVSFAVLMYMVKLPPVAVESKQEKLPGKLSEFRHLIFGSGAIFFYVGAEVAIGSLLVVYLKSDLMGNIPEHEAVALVTYYWSSAMIGRFAGSAITKRIAANKALTLVAAVAFVLVLISMTGPALSNTMDIPVLKMGNDCDTGAFMLTFNAISVPIGAFLLVLVGLFNSIMWPSIFPLGIAKLGPYTAKGSGLMVTMVLGGAIIPEVQGILADSIGYRYSFILCLICYAYIFYFGLKGYKVLKTSDEVLKDHGREDLIEGKSDEV